MTFLNNLDFLSVGVTIASIGILGAIVFLNRPKSDTSESFAVFSILTIAYGLVNYLFYQVTDLTTALFLLRWIIFIAVWHSFFLFRLFYVFPKENIIYPNIFRRYLIPWVCIVSLLNLTPLVFSGFSQFIPKQHITVANTGPLVIVFLLTVVGLIVSSIVLLIRRTWRAAGLEKVQFKLMFAGVAISFTLLAIFNVILPTIFNIAKFVPLGPLFLFPFIFFTFYAIIKHHLLDVKVIATEVFTFLLALATLVDVITAGQLSILLLRSCVFLLVLIFGIILIKNVIKEVKLREQLEVLSKELAEANEKLKALDQARAEFITIASHQLRTPPATIKWYLSAILGGDYGKVPKEILIQLIKTQNTNNHLISLIEDMLNVSRIERGKMEFMFEPTNVEELARFTYEQLLPIAGDKKLKLTYSPPPKSLPVILADKEKLRQVMNNIIDNAIKYTKQGSITVSLEQTGDEIKFQAEDTGKGISEEEKDSIFQKYSRGKESVKQSAGLGLGLYVAKIIIEQHKGKIWAESKGEGKGSIFGFNIPINSGLKQTTLVDLSQPAPK